MAITVGVRPQMFFVFVGQMSGTSHIRFSRAQNMPGEHLGHSAKHRQRKEPFTSLLYLIGRNSASF
jgi:hypothetical protein